MRLLAQVRRAGRVRREPTDWATLLVAIFVLAGLPAQLLVGVIVQGAPESMATAPPALWIAVGLVAALLALGVVTAIGPVRMSPPEYAWALSGVVDRRSELAPRWIRLLLTTGLVGAVLGVSGAAIGGSGVTAVLAGALAGGAVGLGTSAAATGLQGRSERAQRRVRSAVLIAGAAGVAIAAVLTVRRSSIAVPEIWLLIGGLVADLLAVGAVGWGWRSIRTLDRAALGAGHALFSATSAAVLFLEPGLVGDLLAERRLAGLRIRRARLFPAGRLRALLTAELLRTMRNPRAIGLLMFALLVPYAAALVAPAKWLPVVAFVCALAAVSPFGAGFRRISQSSSLRRMLGGTDGALRTLHLVLPAIIALLFTLAVAAAMPPTRWPALALTPIGVLANLLLRARDRPPITNNRIADLGFGPVPVDLTWSYVRELVPVIIVVVLQTWI